MINHERISSGIEGLDVLMNGGIIKNSINSIVGSSGTGKTTFALAYLYQGLLEGDHTLYIYANKTIGTMYKSILQTFTTDFTISINSPQNITHTDTTSGYYIASYGFENQSPDKNGLDLIFVDETKETTTEPI